MEREEGKKGEGGKREGRKVRQTQVAYFCFLTLTEIVDILQKYRSLER